MASEPELLAAVIVQSFLDGLQCRLMQADREMNAYLFVKNN